MTKLYLLIVLCLTLVGCAGANTVRVITVPPRAKVTANGQYAGLSPVSLNQKWWGFGAAGDALHLVIEKDGYYAVRRTISHSQLNERFWSGDYRGGSETGYGNTFIITIPLEKEGGD